MRLRVLTQGKDGAMVAGRHMGGHSLGTSIGSVGVEQTGPCAPQIFNTNFI
jgi:hypothetical protein